MAVQEKEVKIMEGPGKLAMAEEKTKEKKRSGHIDVMARTGYTAIREFIESIGEPPMEYWEDLTEPEKKLWLDAARWVVQERHIKSNAADLQEEIPIAGDRKQYRDLTIAQRTRCYLFVAIIRAFIELDTDL